MTIDELNRLEDRVNHVVSNLKSMREENKKLKAEITDLRNEASSSLEEKQLIKKKVETLIQLLDSLEQADES